MSKFSISLTPKYRLDLQIVRQRGVKMAEPLFPKMSKLRRVRRGSRISRFFRYIFEHKRSRQILGTNLAVAMMMSTLAPQTITTSEEAEKVIVSVQNIPLSTDRAIAYPVNEVKINQGFHILHPGIDLEGVTGDEIRAIMKGKVSEIQNSRFGYGKAILVNHGNGLTSLYAHLSKIGVEEGQEVDTFTKLGEMGSTGMTTGDHLHLEIRDHGKAINPLAVLPTLSQR